MKLRNIALTGLLAMSFCILGGCGSSSNSTQTEPQPQPQPQPQPDPPTLAESLQVLLDNTVGEDVPGVLLHVEGPEIDFTGAAGLSDIETQSPMQIYHQMPVGSAGKKATALLVAMLHEEGLLNIDDLISEYLPASILSNIQYSDQMTIRQLLNHTAGVHDYLDSDTAGEWFAYGIETVGQLKTDINALEFIYNKPAYFEPGTGVQYSNSGYLLAGLILDEILGEHHSVELRNRVLIPLGLNDTYYGGIENELGTSISGYILEDGQMENTKPFFESVGVADAPLVTTASDLSKLLREIMTDDTVITEEIRELLIGEASMVETNYGFDFGLGLFEDNILGQQVYHHGGAEVGYETRNLYFVDDDITVTLFSNCHGYTACDEKTEILIQQVLAKL